MESYKVHVYENSRCLKYGIEHLSFLYRTNLKLKHLKWCIKANTDWQVNHLPEIVLWYGDHSAPELSCKHSVAWVTRHMQPWTEFIQCVRHQVWFTHQEGRESPMANLTSTMPELQGSLRGDLSVLSSAWMSKWMTRSTILPWMNNQLGTRVSPQAGRGEQGGEDA